MKRILLLLVLCLNISMVLGQEYKNWEKYDIEGFYIIAKSKAEAKISKNVLREGADYYILTEMDDQVFPSGVSKKITPKLYKLKDTEIYIFFRTLSKILCKWKQDSAVSLFLYLDSVFKNKHKLIHNQAPVMNRLCPFLLNLHK